MQSVGKESYEENVRHETDIDQAERPVAGADPGRQRRASRFGDQSAVVVAGGGILFTAFLWAYCPTLVDLVRAWNREPDYSHGFLVAPFAAFLLWMRRERFPGLADHVAWAALSVLGLSLVMRYSSARYHLIAIDGWSIPVWIAGAFWLLGGRRVLWWALPCIGFLWFMVPLPYRAERWLSLPLQSVATNATAWVFQCLGQPTVAEGHTILLGGHRLEVEQACSGLRILVGIAALAFAYLLVVRQRWWERLVLLAGVVPIAILANVARIVATGLLYQYCSAEAGRRFTHDFAGWTMILLASGLFGCALWYLRALVREEELVEVGDILRGRVRTPADGHPPRGMTDSKN